MPYVTHYRINLAFAVAFLCCLPNLGAADTATFQFSTPSINTGGNGQTSQTANSGYNYGVNGWCSSNSSYPASYGDIAGDWSFAVSIPGSSGLEPTVTIDYSVAENAYGLANAGAPPGGGSSSSHATSDQGVDVSYSSSQGPGGPTTQSADTTYQATGQSVTVTWNSATSSWVGTAVVKHAIVNSTSSANNLATSRALGESNIGTITKTLHVSY